jgi:hypothetical protein
VAQWWVSLFRVKTAERTRSDGLFLLEFDEGSGLCRSLREWWHMGPEPPEDA